MRTGIRNRALLLGVTASFAMCGLAAAAPAAAAACSEEASNRTLTITPSDAQRSLHVSTDGAHVVVGHSVCSSLVEIDTVVVDVSESGVSDVRIDLRGGPFAPGFTDEADGSSEIELTVLGLKRKILEVFGSSAPDDITMGNSADGVSGDRTGEVNLNAAADGGTPDVDVTLDSSPLRIEARGLAGDDSVSGAGTSTTGSAPIDTPLILDGGEGANALVGGGNKDVLVLQLEEVSTGAEDLSGGKAQDTLHLLASDAPVASEITLNSIADDGAQCPGPECAGDNIGDDIEVIEGTANAEKIVGDAGMEIIAGNGGGDILRGGPGSDILDCAGGRLYGGKGLETIRALPGCAFISGGADNDYLTFVNYQKAVSVSLDNEANDGTRRQHMDIRRDVETLNATRYADTMIGNGIRNEFFGGPGDDLLRGRGGNDLLLGDQGADRISGGKGRDSILGGPGDDQCTDTGPRHFAWDC